MDLPPPATAPTVAGGGPGGARPAIIQTQQRPSLSYLIMLSIIFFMMSSNNEGLREPITDETTLHDLRVSLARREARRDGLADWLHIPRYNTTELDAKLNMSAVEPVEVVEFVPRDGVNELLRTRIRDLVRRRGPKSEANADAYFHQNLTGMARGEWSMDRNWTYETLGLGETWNVTSLQEVKRVDQDNSTTTEATKSEPSTAHESIPRIERRQMINLSNESSAITTHSNRTWQNVTTVMNRTLLRNAFDWSSGGRVLLDLHEDQSTAPGSVIPGKENDELLRINEDVPRADWEQVGPTTFLRGEITFTDKKQVEEARFDIEGVRFLNDGTFYAYATPSWIRSHLFDVVGLPAVGEKVEGETWGQLAAGHTMIKAIDKRIEAERNELRDAIERGSMNQKEEQDPPRGPQCVFTLYGTLNPLPTHYTPALFAEYYSSLYHPTGSGLLPPPSPRIDYLLYSENCGLVLSGQADLITTPRLWEQGTTFAVLVGLTQMIMVWVLARQMDKAAPGHAGKVAYFTIGLQTALDAYFFVSTFTLAIVTDTRASLPFLVPAFFALVSSLIFCMRYAAEIRIATPPPPSQPVPPPPPPAPTVEELAARAAERRAAAAEAEAEGEGDALLGELSPTPTPATTTTTRPPDEVSDFMFLGSGFLIALVAGTIIILFGWIVFLTLLAFSYWIPQIVLNVQRGAARGSLRREYIILTTLGRLVMPSYFWGYRNNVLGIEPSPWVLLLLLYSTTQATILLLQDSRLGARFFLPVPAIEWLKLTELETWDYHPLPSSTANDLESGPISSPFHSEDCPICLSSIQVHPTKEEEDDPSIRARLRWAYMVPPCHHLMHTECMESWIAVKSVCPICRSRLPAL